MKRFLPFLVSSLLLVPFAAAGAGVTGGAEPAASRVSFTLDVTGVDGDISAASVVVFPNDTEEPRVIPTTGNRFRTAKLLIFDRNGKLVEAGGDLYANEDGTYGSPQLSVTIPAHGFMIGFGNSADSRLMTCYYTAFEGAMLYNATMSILYDVDGSYDPSKGQISISYEQPTPASEEAVRFLFVGNSSTYFNGTPIKFKGLCLAAGLDVDVTYCTFGSAYLHQFADASHANGKALRDKLESGRYDYVVFQDAAGASAADTEAALKVLVPMVRERGAKPLLYMRYSTSLSGQSKYYNIYTAMGEEFDAVVAPSAVAYYLCMRDDPEVNLFADDGSHHSAAGSYLIACTWLKAFFGVSPVGNAYTANLDADLAARLQEIALESCETEFAPAGSKPAVFTDGDGKEYVNAAHKRPYTVKGDAYGNESWTDADADGNPIGKWTDGVSATDGTDTAVGCWKGGRVEVTIDLGGVFPLKRVTTDLFGNSGWGIPDPKDATVQFFVSTDGETFTLFGEAESEDGGSGGEWTRLLFAYTAEETADAAYVKAVYKIAGTFCWVSEIEAFAAQAAEEPPKEEPSQEESSQEEPAGDPSSAPEDGSTSAEENPSEPSGGTGKLLPVLLAVLAGAGAVAVAALCFRKKKS
ncbi:MAG: hypothetical protein J1E00_02465 [Oscillospiraceae bacterium]|nr:hypothetical protein [Oscillospiraceae bacterium]